MNLSFRTTRRLAIKLAAAIALFMRFHGALAGDISIQNAWAQATPPKATIGNGYMKIINRSAEPDHLLAVTAEVSRSAEIDGIRMADNAAHMKQLLNFDIPAGGSVEFKPGSYHVLLRNLKKPLTPGETFRGTLTFARSGVISVDYKVEATDPAPPATE